MPRYYMQCRLYNQSYAGDVLLVFPREAVLIQDVPD